MSKALRSPTGKQRRTREAAILTSLAVLIVVIFIVSMNTGLMRLSPLDVLHTVFGEGNAAAKADSL